MSTPLPLDASRVPCRVAPDRWFGDSGDNGMIRIAKAVCQTCPLIAPCADVGIRFEKHGVWGGLSPDERKRIRTELGIVLDTPTMGISYPRRGPTRKPGPDHGDEAGYARHIRHGEKACRDCYQGHLRARQDRSAKRRNAS